MEIIREVIANHYDLGEVALPVQLESAHQRRHRKMTVETGAGKFLVKTYKNDLAVLDALRFQHRLSDHLHDNGLPVARIQRTREGRSLVALDTWALELQEFVYAGPMRMSTPALAHTAEALGKFHLVCRGLRGAPPRDVDTWRFSEAPRGPFENLYRRACAESTDNRVPQWCDQVAHFLHDAAEALAANKRSEFETGLIHGDWHAGNLMFRDDELAAIVDLEFAGDGCYLEDIAYGMSNLCIRTTLEVERMRHRCNVLLDHYQRYRTLSWAELVALYYAVGIKHVTTVSYQLPQHGGQVAGYTATEWIERLAVQCGWLAEQSRRVRWGA
jgi:Ser/Thr protein kinase RdoA (MazF antagonist)